MEEIIGGLTERQANGMLRKLIQIKSNVQRLRESAEEEKTRFLEEHEKKLSGYAETEQKDTEYLIGQLTKYILEHPNSEHLKTKSKLELYAGKIALKRKDPTLNKLDRELKPWLKRNHPEFVLTETKDVEKLNWAGFKETLQPKCVDGQWKVFDSEDNEVEGVAFVEHEPELEIIV